MYAQTDLLIVSVVKQSQFMTYYNIKCDRYILLVTRKKAGYITLLQVAALCSTGDEQE